MPSAQGEDMYRSLRAMALEMTPNLLDLTADGAPSTFAVVMDWSIDEDGASCVTLAAFANGEASLYFSNGGGVIGASKHEAVRAAAQRVVSEAEPVAGFAAPGPAEGLPAPGTEQFTILTHDGPRHIVRERRDSWEEGDPLDALSVAAQVLIGEISRVS